MIYSTGKRKTSIAKVSLNKSGSAILINDQSLDAYFKIHSIRDRVYLPMFVLKSVLEAKLSSKIDKNSIASIPSLRNNTFSEYFFESVNSLSNELASSIISSLNNISFKITVFGGGFKSQAEAILYGIAKCLVQLHPEIRKLLKDYGFLTRDSRIVERKKPGYVKARKVEQYSKR